MKPRICIVISGGCFERVFSNIDIDVDVFDWDNHEDEVSEDQQLQYQTAIDGLDKEYA